MSDPFEFLDEEVVVEKSSARLLYSLAGLALSGLMSIPVVGLLRDNEVSSETESHRIGQEQAIEVELAGESELDREFVLESDRSVSAEEDLQSVDETLAGLGIGETKPALKEGNIGDMRKSQQTPIEEDAEKSIGSSSRQIKVQPGDTLYGLARKYGSTPGEIAGLNGINPDAILLVGRNLTIPGSPDSAASGKSERRLPNAGVTVSISPAAEIGDETGDAGNSPGASNQAQDAAAVPKSEVVALPKPRMPVTSRPVRQVKPATQAQSATSPTISPVSRGGTITGDQPALARKRTEASAGAAGNNPLDQYNTAIAYRVQLFDNFERIANAHALTSEELIQLNGRDNIKKGEMIVVPVDNCLIKNR